MKSIWLVATLAVVTTSVATAAPIADSHEHDAIATCWVTTAGKLAPHREFSAEQIANQAAEQCSELEPDFKPNCMTDRCVVYNRKYRAMTKENTREVVYQLVRKLRGEK